MAFTSDGGTCDYRGRDKSSRKKFESGHLVSPFQEADSVWLLNVDKSINAPFKGKRVLTFVQEMTNDILLLIEYGPELPLGELRLVGAAPLP
jgi:hypothetical protein